MPSFFGSIAEGLMANREARRQRAIDIADTTMRNFQMDTERQRLDFQKQDAVRSYDLESMSIIAQMQRDTNTNNYRLAQEDAAKAKQELAEQREGAQEQIAKDRVDIAAAAQKEKEKSDAINQLIRANNVMSQIQRRQAQSDNENKRTESIVELNSGRFGELMEKMLVDKANIDKLGAQASLYITDKRLREAMIQQLKDLHDFRQKYGANMPTAKIVTQDEFGRMAVKVDKAWKDSDNADGQVKQLKPQVEGANALVKRLSNILDDSKARGEIMYGSDQAPPDGPAGKEAREKESNADSDERQFGSNMGKIRESLNAARATRDKLAAKLGVLTELAKASHKMASDMQRMQEGVTGLDGKSFKPKVVGTKAQGEVPLAVPTKIKDLNTGKEYDLRKGEKPNRKVPTLDEINKMSPAEAARAMKELGVK